MWAVLMSLRAIVPLTMALKTSSHFDGEKKMTKYLLLFAFAIPLAIALLGMMVGLLVPSAGFDALRLAGMSASVIWRNFWAYWPFTVPVTVLAIWFDLATAEQTVS